MPASVLSPDEHFHDQTVVDALARLSAGLWSTAHLPQLPSRAPNGLRSGPRREERKYSTYLNDEQRRDATQMRDFTTGVNPFGALGHRRLQAALLANTKRPARIPCVSQARVLNPGSQPRRIGGAVGDSLRIYHREERISLSCRRCAADLRWSRDLPAEDRLARHRTCHLATGPGTGRHDVGPAPRPEPSRVRMGELPSSCATIVAIWPLNRTPAFHPRRGHEPR